MKTKTFKKNSIQFKTLTYLICFSIIILLLLWASQILFLKIYYEKYQINNLKKVVNTLSKKTFTSEEVESIAYENNICIEYIQNDNQYSFNSLNKNCILNKKNLTINQVLQNFIYSGKKTELIKLNNPKDKSKSLIYEIKLSNQDYMFLNTQLEDVNSTTSVLRNQLIYITLIVIILSIVVSIFLTKMLNKPLIKITSSAKKLGKEKNIYFEKSNIAEIDELVNVLKYANSEITKTDELRRDLLANVSHDLKTPLTMIKAYAEMIRDISIKDEEKSKDNLNIIIDETDRLNYLVNDILNLSKLEANADKLIITEFDLIELINSIIKKYDYIKETENYIFKVNAPTIAVVKADQNKISQVIYNLLNNAINYTGKDLVVTINVKENKNNYRVEIIDTGKGIDKEELNIIWEKYYKNEKNHKRNKVGTGVGLSIVKSILEKHNFNYGVNSIIDKGTIFYFEIKKNSQ